MRRHRNNAAKLITRGVAVSSQMQAMGQNGTDHARRQTHTVGKLQSRQSKIKDRVLHVFGVRGNRGVLDLSRSASQNFRFVSEDLEIKSNTPQVGKIQEAAPTQHIRVEAQGKAGERRQTSKPLIQRVQVM